MIYRGLAIFVAKKKQIKNCYSKNFIQILSYIVNIIPFTVSVFQDADLKPWTKPSNMVL